LAHGIFLAVVTCCVLPGAQTIPEPDSVDLILQPALAEVGLFYGGVDLAISAEVEASLEIAVMVTGPTTELHFGKKEKRWGVLWAPGGDVTFENIPCLYQLRTTAELDQLAPESELAELGLGYETLRDDLADESEGNLFADLIRLKESEGVFSYAAQGVEIEGDQVAGQQRISVTLHFPANAPATLYSVQLFGFRDGQLAARGQGNFELRQATLIHFLSSLAQEHGSLYGFLAVVAAVGAGLLVGLMFGSDKKAH